MKPALDKMVDISISDVKVSELLKGALKIIIQFASTYLCEKWFSSLTEIKTKYRNRLDVSADLKLTSIHPNI